MRDFGNANNTCSQSTIAACCITLGSVWVKKSARDCHSRLQKDQQKVATQRAGRPVFTTIVQLVAPGVMRIYHDVGRAVDAINHGDLPESELRWIGRYRAGNEGRCMYSMLEGNQR